VQVPVVPARSQATQGPAQLSLQQTPSTQNPEVQSQALVQVDPFPRCAVQVVPAQ
jgi:hypothetical protein